LAERSVAGAFTGPSIGLTAPPAPWPRSWIPRATPSAWPPKPRPG